MQVRPVEWSILNFASCVIFIQVSVSPGYCRDLQDNFTRAVLTSIVNCVRWWETEKPNTMQAARTQLQNNRPRGCTTAGLALC